MWQGSIHHWLCNWQISQCFLSPPPLRPCYKQMSLFYTSQAHQQQLECLRLHLSSGDKLVLTCTHTITVRCVQHLLVKGRPGKERGIAGTSPVFSTSYCGSWSLSHALWSFLVHLNYFKLHNVRMYLQRCRVNRKDRTSRVSGPMMFIEVTVQVRYHGPMVCFVSLHLQSPGTHCTRLNHPCSKVWTRQRIELFGFQTCGAGDGGPVCEGLYLSLCVCVLSWGSVPVI